MSDIRDRAHTGLVKSCPIWDTGFPVAGKKFRIVPFKPLVRSGQEQSWTIFQRDFLKPLNGPVVERNWPKNARLGTDFFSSTTV